MKGNRFSSAVIIFVTFCSLCWPACILAVEEVQEIGKVIAVRGEVIATDQSGEKRSLVLQDPVYQGDTITTGKRSRAQILFRDQSVTSLGRDTVFTVSLFQQDSDSGKGNMVTEVHDGFFRVMGGIISKKSPENVKVKTPAATIGIRGSMYSAKVTNGILQVIFEGGKGITLQNNTGLIDISRPGYGTQVGNIDESLGTPIRFNLQQLEQIHGGFSLRDSVQSPTLEGKAPEPPVSDSPSPSPVPGTRGAVELEQPARQKLQDSVQDSPTAAPSLLKKAVEEEGVPLDAALQSTLMGMENTSRETFDQVITEAIKQGLTLEQAKEIIQRFKESGGVCR